MVIIASIACVLMSVVSARGEVLTRRDGTRIAGKCRLRGKEIAVARGLTTVYIPLANVARVDLHPTEERELAALRARYETRGAPGRFRLGEWLDDHLQFREAEEQYRRSIELDPDHAASRRALGYRKDGRNWVPDPAAQLERASKGFGDGAADACVRLGKAYTADGNDKAAEKAFRAALVADPTHAEALKLIAPCLANVKLHNTYRNPLDGKTLVVSGHNHRMFAYMLNAVDLAVVDDKGRLVEGDARKLESYHTYGAAVHAAAAGEVFSVKDDFPDMPAGHVGNFLEANSVCLRHPGGEYTLYAHLMKGSAVVRKGQHVKAGELLGKVGNSGSTMTPHLHFCVYDVDAISLPFTFAARDADEKK
ncbi:MAG TPA: peptidoglycan DD-metalloendopeptidase family protein [Planctomycetota bacterium]|nr:peptidoglycan DD-metalloendopeptidase family protein [Planctomycetota bacterium]